MASTFQAHPSVRRLLLGVSLSALTALGACGGPLQPEPAPPPPEPEQMEPELLGAPDEAYPVDDRPDEDPLYPDELVEDVEEDKPEPAFDPEFVPDLAPPVRMDPIPNPSGEDRLGRRLRGEPPLSRDSADRAERAAPPVESEDGKPEPESERFADIGEIEAQARRDAAGAADDAPPPAYGQMRPIPNPEPRARPAAGLRGGPDERLARAAPPAVRSTPTPGASGPRVRVPIQRATPAPSAPAAAQPRPASPPPAARVQRPAAPALRGAQTPQALAAAATPQQRFQDASEQLRRLVERDAQLEVPTQWVQGETREVRLRLPDSFAADLERATAGLEPDGPREVSATLRGEGFRIDPPGPQATAADPGAALAWRVTPERANPGPLSASVEASVPGPGGERATLTLGEVDDGRAAADGLSLRTLGWILLVVLGGGLLAWLAGRRGGGSEAAASRRRRRARDAERRDAQYRAMDLSPGERGGEAPQRA